MNLSLRSSLAVGAIVCAACNTTEQPPSGGGTLQTGPAQALYVTNVDHGSVTRIDLPTGTMREIAVGVEPTRIARQGNRIFVTLRAERGVKILEDDGTTLKEVGRIATGAEPFGVVATIDRLYVAASVGGTVDEYDLSNNKLIRTWHLPGEPRWLTIHPKGGALFVASTYGGHLNRIELASGVVSPVKLPDAFGFGPFRGSGSGLLARRITGDMAFTPDGAALLIPGITEDIERPIRDVDAADIDLASMDPNQAGEGGAVIGCDSLTQPPPDGMGMDRGNPCGPGGGGGYDSEKINPVVDEIPVDVVTGEPVQNATPVVYALRAFNGSQVVASYPAAVAVAQRGEEQVLVAALEGSASIVSFVRSPQIPMHDGPSNSLFGSTFSAATAAGPRGLMVDNGKIYVHSFLDNRVETFLVKDLIPDADGAPFQPHVIESRTVASTIMDADIDEGRRLFYAANDPRVAQVGAAVSCATCHFDGRSDGFTLMFERGPRQVPNLSADLANALPIGWAGNVGSIAQEGFSTSQRLMGGHGLTPAMAVKLERYVLQLRRIDTPNRGTEHADVSAGRDLFLAKGCGTCHGGAALTDNRPYAMLGMDAVKTRPLVGVAASAPFFHDGSAANLEEVVDRAAAGDMGGAFSITNQERAQMVAYLKSL